LHRLLRALVTIEIVREREDDNFELLPMGALLRNAAAASLRSWAIFVGRYQGQEWGHLLDSVKTGESARQLLTGTEGPRHREQNLELAAVFSQAMVELTQLIAPVEAYMMKLEERRKRLTSWRLLKLLLTFFLLLGLTVTSLAFLLSTGASSGEVTSISTLPLGRLWLLAVLGGVLGGVVRALYSFLFDNYAFHFWVMTGRSSPFIRKLCGGIKDIEDDFDPLECWYLYFVKPLLGGTLGLLFALVIDLGLIAFGADATTDKAPLRNAVVGGLAGLFAENVLHRMRYLVAGQAPDGAAQQGDAPDR
jgi:hypothetical protein